MKSSLRAVVIPTLRWVLGLLLLWAALSKLANLNEFYGNVLAYRLPLPDLFQRLVAVTLPWLELLCGLMLIANLWIRPGLAWAIILFACFAVITAEAWARGLDISCGCFKLSMLGFGHGPTAVQKVFESVGFTFFRALLLTLAALYLFHHYTRA